VKIFTSKQIIYFSIISLFITQLISSFLFNLNIFFVFHFLLNIDRNDLNFKNINRLLVPLPVLSYGLVTFNAYNNKNLLFYDNQLLFTLFNCNKSYDFQYFQRFSLEQLSCRSSVGFGMVERIIVADFSPWNASIFIAICFVSFLYFLIFQVESDEKFLFILFFVSPPFLFLFTSLNSDIFFFSHLLYLVIKRKTHITKIDYLIITILSQLKIFYLGILFGITLFNFIKKDKKELILSFLFIVLNSLLFIYDFLTNTRSSYQNEIFGVPYVYAPMNTFGVVADIRTFYDVQLSIIENSKFILFVSIIFIIIFFVFIKNNPPSFNAITNDKLALFLYILPTCLIINFFGNAGYKFVFNFLLVYLILELLNFNQKLFIFSIFLVIPIFSILNLVNDHTLYTPSLFNSFVWMYSRIVFYVLNLSFLIVLFNIFRLYLNSLKSNQR
tara:strand:+ start:121 stop:1446 length:1326 start_codon:yes stop_codon:yes gene_type:complete